MLERNRARKKAYLFHVLHEHICHIYKTTCWGCELMNTYLFGFIISESRPTHADLREVEMQCVRENEKKETDLHMQVLHQLQQFTFSIRRN